MKEIEEALQPGNFFELEVDTVVSGSFVEELSINPDFLVEAGPMTIRVPDGHVVKFKELILDKDAVGVCVRFYGYKEVMAPELLIDLVIAASEMPRTTFLVGAAGHKVSIYAPSKLAAVIHYGRAVASLIHGTDGLHGNLYQIENHEYKGPEPWEELNHGTYDEFKAVCLRNPVNAKLIKILDEQLSRCKASGNDIWESD